MTGIGTPLPGHGHPLRVLVLTKRQYMARDLIDDRYGRFRELPLALSAGGAEVTGVCLSYRKRPELLVNDFDEFGSVTWSCINLPRILSPGDRNYFGAVNQVLGGQKPDVVWACSDVFHCVLGAVLARKLGCRLVIDLYDNFESYPVARIPGMNLLLRRSIRAADAITCVSSPLASMVTDRYRFQKSVSVIENAVPTGVFRRQPKTESRLSLGLPVDGLLIGTVGAMSESRGTSTLIAAFEKVALARPDAHLVLAGSLDPGLELPKSERIHFLGLRPAGEVPQILSSLDISVVCNRDSGFGRYCFPQKLYESLSCQVPVVVARVGAMSLLLQKYPQNLYEPDDVEDLSRALMQLAMCPTVPNLNIPTWTSLGQRLLDVLSAATE